MELGMIVMVAMRMRKIKKGWGSMRPLLSRFAGLYI